MYELKREELEQEKKKNLEKPVFYVRGKGGWSQELKEREIKKKKKSAFRSRNTSRWQCPQHYRRKRRKKKRETRIGVVGALIKKRLGLAHVSSVLLADRLRHDAEHRADRSADKNRYAHQRPGHKALAVVVDAP